jgi:hypothetical protein
MLITKLSPVLYVVVYNPVKKLNICNSDYVCERL